MRRNGAKPSEWIRVYPFRMKVSCIHRLCRFATAVLLFHGMLGVALAQTPTGDEKYLFDAVNHERAERGLRALKWDAALAEAARRHTTLMADRHTLSHQLPGEAELQVRAQQAAARFIQIAENIGEASEAEDLHYGWMHSPPHRANILSAKLTSIGIAVEHRGKVYFATQDFSVAVPDLSLSEQEDRIAKLLEKRGLRVARGNAEARQACRSNGDYPDRRPGGVAHFETADLTALPDGVVKMIARDGFRTAEVGACEPTPSGGFTRYRIAVLLY